MARHALPGLSLVGLLLAVATTAAQNPGKVTIGLVPSMTKELSEAQQKFIAEEFPQLVKEFTGLGGDLDKPSSVAELAEKLTAGKDQFGVFQGIEFAEVREKNPHLQPLLLSIYRTPEVKAIVVVKKDSPVGKFADLKGKDVTILKDGKEHIRRFTMKEAGGDPEKFFSKVVAPTNSEAALDAVLLGKVQAAIVDKSGLDVYREINPGRFNRLKIIGESPVFPPSVIAYDPKQVDEKLVNQFKSGMLKANQSAKGREVMSTFKITSFEPVPAGFDAKLTEIRKAYP
jgi:ABC-type phosphate/phosphonate transport system substrate-binding protein